MQKQTRSFCAGSAITEFLNFSNKSIRWSCAVEGRSSGRWGVRRGVHMTRSPPYPPHTTGGCTTNTTQNQPASRVLLLSLFAICSSGRRRPSGGLRTGSRRQPPPRRIPVGGLRYTNKTPEQTTTPRFRKNRHTQRASKKIHFQNQIIFPFSRSSQLAARMLVCLRAFARTHTVGRSLYSPPMSLN